MPDITYDPANFQPLQVRAWLQTGIISDRFLPLDGVLYYHTVRKAFENEEFVTVPGVSILPESIGITLPIRKANAEQKSWFYKCSFAQWPEHTIEDQQTYSKRFDIKFSRLIDFGKKRGNVSTASGRYKGYHVKVYYRHALYVDWYVDGDRVAIENLLRFCTHLGKKPAQGWGAVNRWEVSSIPHDRSVRDDKGNLMRAVPIDKPSFTYGLRPSYWEPKHQFNVALPL